MIPTIDEEIREMFEQANEGFNQVTFDERGRLSYCSSSVSLRIKILGELFTEYYLNQPDDVESLGEFLQKEELDKFLSEEDYLNLIQGKAYLPEETLNYFRLKLPFDISKDKLHDLNNDVKKQNKYAEKLKLDILGILDEANQLKKIQLEDRERRYHEYDVRYRILHREEIAEKHRRLYHEDEAYRQKILESSRKRYASLSPEARERMYQQQREKYKDPARREYVLRKNRRRYALEKQRMAEDPEYAAKIREQRRLAKREQRRKEKEEAKAPKTTPSITDIWIATQVNNIIHK